MSSFTMVHPEVARAVGLWLFFSSGVEVPVAIVVGVLLAAVLLGAGCAVALIKKGRRTVTSEQEGLALQSPPPAARARPPGKARKTASKKGARRLVDDEAAGGGKSAKSAKSAKNLLARRGSSAKSSKSGADGGGLGLRGAAAHAYTKGRTGDGAGEVAAFAELAAALSDARIDAEPLWQTLAALIHLGDVSFEATDDGGAAPAAASAHALEAACVGLGVTPELLTEQLTSRWISVGMDDVCIPTTSTSWRP